METAPTFTKYAPSVPSVREDKFRVPNVNLIWRDSQAGPGANETTKIAFIRQGFVLAVLDEHGKTTSTCFVPRPEPRWTDE